MIVEHKRWRGADGRTVVEVLSPRQRRALRHWWRTYRAWVIVALVAVLLGSTGLAGAGSLHPLRGERFQSLQVVVQPDGATGVRVRETWDVDFGRHDRRGLRREIPTELGVPRGLQVTSPDANTEVRTEQSGDIFDIRIGNVDEFFSGQHRYVVSYTLPDALQGTDSLALDIVDVNNPLVTERVEVVVSGFDFDATFCDYGSRYTHGGCELVRDGAVYRASIDDVLPEQGVTISGDGARPAPMADVAAPPLPDRPDRFPRLMGLTLAAAALVPVALLHLFGRWYGVNRVRAGGPTAAAFADADQRLTPVTAEALGAGDFDRVPDAELDELITTEFVPPAGLRAWQGVLAVNETIDARSVTAWFSDLIAAEALTVTASGESFVRLAKGPNLANESERDRRVVETLFGDRSEVSLGGADQRSVAGWQAAMRMQEDFARDSGWWRRNAPEAAGQRTPIRINPYWVSIIGFHVVVLGLILLQARFFTLIGALLRAPFVMLSPPVVAIGATAIAAGWAYLAPSRRVWPARSEVGSAVALRTLSFERFLDRSEGQHVQWAWEQGRLREYSAWAVALGASNAWGQAIESTKSAPGIEFVGVPPDLAQLQRAFVDLDVDTRPRRRPFDNPWPRYAKALASSGGGGGSSGRRSGGGYSRSSSGSRGVSRGGGGGRSSTW